MKKTFKDRAVSTAAKISKKHKFLKPLALFVLGIVILFYNFLRYFATNGKRYITICFAVIFFFMSSSFATPDQTVDEDVYITSNEINDLDVSVAPTEVVVIEDVKTPITDVEFIDDDDDVIETENLSKSLNLEEVKEEDSFSLEDFYSDIILSDDLLNLSESKTSDFDLDAWYLILVNKTHPLPDDYEVPLTTLSGSMKCDERVKDFLLTMLKAAGKDGFNLRVCSPYRDYKLQETLFIRKINTFIDQGYSYLDSYKLASRKVIIPGASEHQLGIAFDILSSTHSSLNSAFGNTDAGKWLKSHCAEYGFILRYPKGKEDITGVVYEPWHFRYVGVEAATYIMENDITLEEFIEEIK